MSMVVECESCRSRFRLNESLLKESNAVRFRCRRCGEPIMVRNPRAAPAIHAPAVHTKTPGPPATADISSLMRPGIDHPPPRERAVPPPPARGPAIAVPAPPALSDISSLVRPRIDPSPPRERTDPPPPAREPAKDVPAPPELPVRPVPRLEDLVAYSPAKVVASRKVSARGAPSSVRNILIVGLPILLLAGGFLYFGTALSGQELLGKWFPPAESSSRAGAAAGSAFDIRDLKSATREQTMAGNLFVVSGTVVNLGKERSRGIQIRATLLGEDNQVLTQNTSLAGNTIDDPILRHMKRDSIETYLKMEQSEGGENREIRPNESLPFMVVFFDPLGKVGSFTVHAVDAE